MVSGLELIFSEANIDEMIYIQTKTKHNLTKVQVIKMIGKGEEKKRRNGRTNHGHERGKIITVDLVSELEPDV